MTTQMPTQKKNLSEVGTIKKLLEGKEREIADSLPSHIPAKKLIRTIITQLSNNPALQQCTQTSLIGAMLQSCLYGLEPDGREAALVPFFNGKTKMMEAKFISMIRGEVKLVRQSGEVSDVYAEVVKEFDVFKITKGLSRDLIHEPNYEKIGKPIGVYAVYKLKDGTTGFEYMTVAEIEKVRASSKAANSAPWVDWWEQMAKKTVLKRLLKFAPSSVDKNYVNTDVLPDAGHRVLSALELPTPEQEAASMIDAPRRKSEVETVVSEETGEVIDYTNDNNENTIGEKIE